KLSAADVYVETVGGIRLSEPGADLAIALAVASATKDKALSNELAAIGEISLAGEIRAVTSSGQRASEAKRLGFHTVIDTEAKTVKQALSRAFESSSNQKAPF
ncbi:MAG: magnesium chelatase domain-containing protein, partial [Pontimonas sp.]